MKAKRGRIHFLDVWVLVPENVSGPIYSYIRYCGAKTGGIPMVLQHTSCTYCACRRYTPGDVRGNHKPPPDLGEFRWKSHCHGLYQQPVSAGLSSAG
jgi:hypothetical protein